MLKICKLPHDRREEYTVNESGQKCGIYRLFDKDNTLVEKRLFSKDVELWSNKKSMTGIRPGSVFRSVSGLTIVKYYDHKFDIKELLITIANIGILLKYRKKTPKPYSISLIRFDKIKFDTSIAQIPFTCDISNIGFITLPLSRSSISIPLLSQLKSWPKIVETEVDEIVDVLYYDLSPSIGVFNAKR